MRPHPARERLGKNSASHFILLTGTLHQLSTGLIWIGRALFAANFFGNAWEACQSCDSPGFHTGALLSTADGGPTQDLLMMGTRPAIYNVHQPILSNTIPPLLLSCCFYLLKELPCMRSLGFVGEYSGSLSSGLLLTTSRDHPRRTGGKV